MTIFSVSPSNAYIEVNTGGDPSEVLKVKRLPGRAYDDERQVWKVPVLPGLCLALEQVYSETGALVADLIEETEARFLEQLEAPKHVDIYKISAVEACNIAMTFHLYDYHKGNMSDYSRAHWPFVFGE